MQVGKPFDIGFFSRTEVRNRDNAFVALQHNRSAVGKKFNSGRLGNIFENTFGNECAVQAIEFVTVGQRVLLGRNVERNE